MNSASETITKFRDKTDQHVRENKNPNVSEISVSLSTRLHKSEPK